MKTSVIVLTYNNYSSKYGCIETVILSLMVQKYVEFEVIVVDNCSDKADYEQLANFIDSLQQRNRITLVKNSINNISAGRNLGCRASSGEMLVYMDDDIILPNDKVIFKLSEHFNDADYGYSAYREWMEEGWYEDNREKINHQIRSQISDMSISTKRPNPVVRRKKINRHLIRTYIGNFGFIKKQLLIDTGYWDENFVGYGYEDDAMALELYLKSGRPQILKDISVIHVWHRISEHNYNQLNNNKLLYDQKLAQHKIKCFHIGRLMYGENPVIDYICEQ